MVNVGYEEKQYENAANFELMNGGARFQVWPCGQVAEAILGYDTIAALPTTSPLWSFFRVRPRSGIVLNPTFWCRRPQQPPAATLPSLPVSVVLQYKRPQYLLGTRSSQRGFWGSTPVYRIDVSDPPGQRETLTELERRIGAQALVRYAAPAAQTLAQLWDLQASGQVLAESSFLRPGRLRRAQHVWTYAGPGNRGYANAEPEEIKNETFEDLTELIAQAQQRAGDDSILAHLQHLATELDIPQLDRAAIAGVRESIDIQDLPDERVQALHNLLEFGQRVVDTGASWFVAMRT